ncbi:NAD(P)H-binding protein [Amycolatopsis sp. OK19-0408]|uniref:NAD(P)H-binding protein n=1 Tax=Amycolatopsis iheyensis TaxID=2945988 RepID=A0A9X2SJA8_9PSEU|nr:NAD(P)H-binding protein [Amycolatopsis iheyensis]MCR6484582.1 NAD(P)H-binding protein [Amycolatopsis iheyensis]
MFLVTGATGNVGAALVSALAEAGTPVRALVRRADVVLPDGAEAAVGDLNDPAGLDAALEGVEGIFLLSGYDDMPAMLARARAAGVRRIVLLSGGSAELEDLGNAVSRYMTLAERAVRESGLDWTFLRPRAFMSNALRWLPQLREGDTIRAQFPDVAAACVAPEDIAAVAAVALAGGHEGRTYDLTGPVALRPAEVVAQLAEVLGRDLKCVELSNAETRAELEASMPQPYVDAFWNFYVEGTLDEATVHSDVAEVTGRPAWTLAEWARAHADAFR